MSVQIANSNRNRKLRSCIGPMLEVVGYLHFCALVAVLTQTVDT